MSKPSRRRARGCRRHRPRETRRREPGTLLLRQRTGAGVARLEFAVAASLPGPIERGGVEHPEVVQGSSTAATGAATRRQTTRGCRSGPLFPRRQAGCRERWWRGAGPACHSCRFDHWSGCRPSRSTPAWRDRTSRDRSAPRALLESTPKPPKIQKLPSAPVQAAAPSVRREGKRSRRCIVAVDAHFPVVSSPPSKVHWPVATLYIQRSFRIARRCGCAAAAGSAKEPEVAARIHPGCGILPSADNGAAARIVSFVALVNSRQGESRGALLSVHVSGEYSQRSLR